MLERSERSGPSTQVPYGLVVLDREGRVVAYNDTESRLARLAKDRVIGKNFFLEVAPCTRVREFEGRFRAFAAGETRTMVETFDFVFQFAHGTQHVSIFVTPGRVRGTFDVAMLRRKVGG
jgi:photoactive yellow protein